MKTRTDDAHTLPGHDMPYRIAVVGTRGFPDVQGGIERHCEELYPRLAEWGCRITVYGRAQYLTQQDRVFNGVTVKGLWCPRRKCFEAIVHTVFALLYIKASRCRPDVVHIHGVGPSIAAPLARVLGFRVVCTNHGPDYNRQKWGRLAKRVLRLGERLSCTFADAIVAVSKGIAGDLQRHYGREAVHIPNGVPPAQMKRPGALHDQLGIRPHQFLLTVARLVPEKGLHDLIAATDRQSRYPVVIVGDADHPDPYSKQLREQASRHPRIIMAGLLAREPLSELYANAHGFILPSYHEGLPICLLEAMSYGLPAILSDISANRELVGEPEWVFNPGDIDHLSELLTRCQASGFPAEYGETLKLRALDQYNWNTIAHQTYELYESVLAKDV